MFLILTPKIGEDYHFDDHVFQRGWFNHQLDNFFKQKKQKVCLGAAPAWRSTH